MTDRRILCPNCHIDITGDAKGVMEDDDLLGDWDCDVCGAAFNITSLGKPFQFTQKNQ